MKREKVGVNGVASKNLMNINFFIILYRLLETYKTIISTKTCSCEKSLFYAARNLKYALTRAVVTATAKRTFL